MICFQPNLKFDNWSYGASFSPLLYGGPNLIWRKQNSQHIIGYILLLLVGYKFSSSEFKEGQIWLIATTLDLKKQAYNYCIHQLESIGRWQAVVRYIIVGSLVMLRKLCLKTGRIVRSKKYSWLEFQIL